MNEAGWFAVKAALSEPVAFDELAARVERTTLIAGVVGDLELLVVDRIQRHMDGAVGPVVHVVERVNEVDPEHAHGRLAVHAVVQGEVPRGLFFTGGQ